jgi:HEAT repeat protein
VPALAALLPEEEMRAPVAEALARLGPASAPALDALIAQFKSTSADDAALPPLRKAIAAIGAPAVAAVARLLEDADPALRLRAAQTLEEIGPNAKAATPALVAALLGESKELAEAAGRVLAKLGADAVPPLIEALKDERAAARASAARLLGQLGAPAALPALAALKPLEKDPDPAVQAAAKEALAKIGPEPKRRPPRSPKP